MQDWIADEFEFLDLGDERRNNRLRNFVDNRMKHPTLSIPAATTATDTATHTSEVAASYRLLDNKSVTPQGILAPHYLRTLERIRKTAVVIVAQDTTEIDLTRPIQRVDGVGPLGSALEERVGAFCHALLALTDEGVPLGLLKGKLWARSPDDPRHKLTAAERARLRDSTPFEDKESVRWVEGYREACSAAAACPQSKIVCVSDSESDIFELFQETKRTDAGRRAHWIVRACQHRKVLDAETDNASTDDRSPAAATKGKSRSAADDRPPKELFEAALKLPKFGEQELSIRARPATSGQKRKAARSARQARCQLRAGTIEIAAPQDMGAGVEAVTVNAVLLRELDPPKGEAPIEWLLLTDLPIDRIEDVRTVVSYYCHRWGVETYFKVLKSGCRIEASRLETLKRFSNFLAVNMVVAWRLCHLTLLCREHPDLPCTAVFTPDEWRAAYAHATKKHPPKTPPSLAEMIEIIGSLGGWIKRKNGGPPGVKSMWIGLQRVNELADGWKAQAQFASKEKSGGKN